MDDDILRLGIVGGVRSEPVIAPSTPEWACSGLEFEGVSVADAHG